MATRNILYKREYPVNQFISIRIPTVGEVLEDEDEYYGIVALVTAMPIDMMVQLDDIGIDFTTINAWDLFLLMFKSLQERDTSIVFGDLDLTQFQLTINEQNGNVVLRNGSGVTIDREIHAKMASVCRMVNHLEQNRKRPGNDEAKAYMLERARIKMKRHQKMSERSQIEDLIVAMVNTEQYKYGFEETLGLTIYQFNESVRQVVKKVNYEHTMHGVYAGTVSAKDLNQDDLNWLSHK